MQYGEVSDCLGDPHRFEQHVVFPAVSEVVLEPHHRADRIEGVAQRELRFVEFVAFRQRADHVVAAFADEEGVKVAVRPAHRTDQVVRHLIETGPRRDHHAPPDWRLDPFDAILS